MQNNHACILHALDMTCMYKTSLYVHAPFVPVQVVAACTQSMETKICYPHCMWKVPSEVSGFKGQLKYVDSCPNEPVPAKAFCHQHCVEAEQQGIPTNLQEYKPSTTGLKHTLQLELKSHSYTKLLWYTVKKTTTLSSSSADTAAKCQG